MADQSLVSVTIRLTDAEVIINPSAQSFRFTRLDGRGCPIGATEEMSLSAAIGALRGILANIHREASRG
jgi:hypothetical protein